MLLAALAWTSGSSGVDTLRLEVGAIEGPGWTTGPIALSVHWRTEQRLDLELAARDLRLPGALRDLRRVTLRCAGAEAQAAAAVVIACPQGTIELEREGQQPWRYTMPLRIAGHEHGWQIEASGEVHAGGRWRARLEPGPKGAWHGAIDIEQVDLQSAWQLAAGYLEGLPALSPTGSASASVSVSRRMSGGSSELSLEVSAVLTDVAFSDDSGLHAGEGLRIELDADTGPVDTDSDAALTGRARVTLTDGELYLDPVYFQLTDQPLDVQAGWHWRSNAGALVLDPIHVEHQGVGVFDARLSAELAKPVSIDRLALRLARCPFSPMYAVYLQPFLFGGPLGKLAASGELAGAIDWRRDGDASAELELFDIGVEDQSRRFQLSDVAGAVYWRSNEPVASSRLGWSSARVYRIDLGASQLEGTAVGHRFVLARAASIPVLDGALEISTLDIDGLATSGLSWRLAGELAPVSLAKLSAALDWPSFPGTVAGRVPVVRNDQGIVAVDGSLSVQAFDGEIRLDGLQIEDPFGVVPILRTDASLDNLSLGALTHAFSFGNIEGRLGGAVAGLVLEDWKPTRFRAELATPAGDSSRHRISQRAVRNLASIGGAGAVLSTTFLALFSEFSYDRLGIRCHLMDGICEMGGVEPAPHGYYIVKGGGLPPRIDVIGINERVDWDTLVERLRGLTSTEGPVVR